MLKKVIGASLFLLLSVSAQSSDTLKNKSDFTNMLMKRSPPCDLKKSKNSGQRNLSTSDAEYSAAGMEHESK